MPTLSRHLSLLLAFLFAVAGCNGAEGAADRAAKAYGGPFSAIGAGAGDCAKPVEVARELLKMESAGHAKLKDELAKHKSDVSFRARLSEGVQKLHESEATTTFAKSCPRDAVQLGEVARESAALLGIDDLVPRWPATRVAPVHQCASDVRCTEYIGSDFSPETVERSCSASGRRWAERECSRIGAIGICHLDRGGPRASAIVIYGKAGETADGARKICEQPQQGEPPGAWEPGPLAAAAKSVPAAPSSAPAGLAPQGAAPPAEPATPARAGGRAPPKATSPKPLPPRPPPPIGGPRPPDELY